MRLCFFASANSVHSKTWIKYFADRGYEVYWISVTPNTVGEIKNVKSYYLEEYPVKILDVIFNLFRMRKLIKEIKPDILHAHYAGVNGVLGVLSGFHPYILTAWGSDILINPDKNIINKLLISKVLKRADLITCNGEPIKQEMIELGVKSEKIKLIFWAIDVSKFKPKDKYEPGSFYTIISLRNLEPVYNLETLINSVPIVLKDFPRTKFIIAGKGSEKTKLRELAKSLGVIDSIKFVGWISSEKISWHLRSSDVYVSTSLSDGDLSQATQQAMACGVPVITTDIEVNKKRIKDNKDGLLFPVRDPESLAKKIISLLMNKELRKKLGREGRKTIKRDFNYFEEMKKMENYYQKLIKE